MENIKYFKIQLNNGDKNGNKKDLFYGYEKE